MAVYSSDAKGPQPATPIWRVEMLGGLRVRRLDIPDSSPIEKFRSQRAAALLVYLARDRRLYNREALADHFWPEATSEDGKASLRTTLSSLRAQLEPDDVEPGSILLANRVQAGLSPFGVTTDVEEFSEAVESARIADTPDSRRLALEEAVNLYTGSLLSGHTGIWLDSWISTEGFRLEEIYFESLRSLTELLEENGESAVALAYLRRGAVLDPLREDIQRDVLRLIPRGEEAAALRHFEKWQKTLERAGSIPEARTLGAAEELRRRLKQSIRKETAGNSPSPSAPTKPVRFERTPPAVPPTWNSFHGRDVNVQELAEMLRDKNLRLITITGPGGSGKTRLALELAHAIHDGRLDGQSETGFQLVPIYVPLADLSTSEVIFSSILEVLGEKRGNPTATAVAAILEAFRQGAGTRFVLILDNFEHLVDSGAPLVRQILEKAPDVVCLVTSRRPLALRGEQQYPLKPLPVASQAFQVEQAAGLASVQLFFDRARRVRRDFKWTRANVEVVARLCSLLDGLPLAIEIAAARTLIWSPAQILSELDTPARRRQTLLDWQSNDTESPPRHHSLRRAIEWSAKQLPVAAARFWARLWVFRGGWSLEDAEEICQEANAPALLLALRDASLVSLDSGDQLPLGAPRGSMLEALRQYAGESLSPEERAGLEARHAKCYLALAESARPHLGGADAHKWAARLDQERDNLRAATEWYLQHDPEGAMRLMVALWWSWELKGQTGEGRRWLERTIVAVEQAFPDLEASWIEVRQEGRGDHRSSTLLRLKAQVLNGAGKLAMLQSCVETAMGYLEEAMRIFQLLEDKGGEADALYSLGYARAKTGELEVGKELCERSVAMNRARGDEAALSDSLYNLSLVELFYKDFASVRRHSQERLDIHVRANSPRGMATSLETLGMAALMEGDGEAAGAYFAQALQIFHSFQEWPSVARAQWGLGHVLRGAGRFEEAMEAFTPAMQISVETHNTWAIPYMLESFGYLAADMGQLERAVTLLAASSAFRERYREPLPEGAFRDLFAGYAEAARAAFGDAAFQAQWDIGLTMESQAAIKFALGRASETDDFSV